MVHDPVLVFAPLWIISGWIGMACAGVRKWYKYYPITRGEIVMGFFLGVAGPTLMIFVLINVLSDINWDKTVVRRKEW